MPRISERKSLLREWNELLIQLAIDGRESTKDFSEIMELAASLSRCRFLNSRDAVPKSEGWKEIFFSFPEGDFRQMVRMDQISFLRLLQKIEDHPIFYNESSNAQEKIWIQLAVALNRLGCFGNGISIGRVARFAGVSNGTVWNFTRRVITAIISLTDDNVHWPDEEQRQRIARRFYAKHGLKHCVGIVDGTPVVFMQKPGIDGEAFWDRYICIF